MNMVTAASGISAPSSRPELSLDTVIAEITSRREGFEILSHVPRDMIETMARARILRASTPKCFGGDAAPPADFMRVLERIAMADGSVPWVAAFGSANVYLGTTDRPDQVIGIGAQGIDLARPDGARSPDPPDDRGRPSGHR